MVSWKANGSLPYEFTVQEAASLIGMTAGGLRGAILRGRLRAEKDEEGKLVIRSHNLAAFHLYGDGRLFPEENMKPSTRVTLHHYLETVTCG